MKRVNPATVKTLASRLGVSTATVSFALGESPEVSPATRARVVAEAERQGYVGNPLIAAWMRRVRGAAAAGGLPVVAYVTGYSRQFHGDIPHLCELARGVEREAGRLGFPLAFFYDAGVGVSWDEVAERLSAAQVSGVILAPFVKAAPVRLPWERFCWVAIGYSADRPPMHTIMDEHLLDTRAALDALARRGARRIGLVTAAVHESHFSHARTAAFLSWQRGLPAGERVPIHRIRYGTSETEIRVKEWARRHRVAVVVSPCSMRGFFRRSGGPDEPLRFQLGLSPDAPDFARMRGTIEANREMGALAMDTLAGLLYRHEMGLPAEPVEVSVGGPLILTAADRKAFLRQRRLPPLPPAPRRAVTLREIARHLGIALGAVSLALRDDPRVPAAKRRRVRAAARRLGYGHNPLTDAWAGRFHETHRHAGLSVAHVSGYPETAYQADAALRELRAQILERAGEIAASVTPFYVDAAPPPREDSQGSGGGAASTRRGAGGLSVARLREILEARGIETVLWGPFPPEQPPFEENWPEAVMVGIGDAAATRALNRVVHSRYLGLRGLLLRLLEAGCRKPGLAGCGPPGAPDGVLGWAPAYLQIATTLPAQRRVPWLPLARPDREACAAWFDRHRPDVVLSNFPELRDAVAGAAFIALEPDPDRLSPDLAALLYPAAALGRGAMDLLVAQCDLNERGRPARPYRTAYRARFRPGPSCPGLP